MYADVSLQGCEACHDSRERDMGARLAHVPELEVEDGQGLRQVIHGARGLPGALHRGCDHGSPLQDGMHVGRLHSVST